jgi:hypothetical protein
MLLRQRHAAGTNTEAMIALEPVDLRANKGAEPTFNSVSHVSIGDDDLPYKHLITAATHSLYLRLDDLSLAVDFATGASGHLLVTRAQDTTVEGKECCVVEVEDIPVTKELQFDCPSDSNELNVLFQSSLKGIVYVTFVWEMVSTWAT